MAQYGPRFIGLSASEQEEARLRRLAGLKDAFSQMKQGVAGGNVARAAGASEGPGGVQIGDDAEGMYIKQGLAEAGGNWATFLGNEQNRKIYEDYAEKQSGFLSKAYDYFGGETDTEKFIRRAQQGQVTPEGNQLASFNDLLRPAPGIGPAPGGQTTPQDRTQPPPAPNLREELGGTADPNRINVGQVDASAALQAPTSGGAVDASRSGMLPQTDTFARGSETLPPDAITGAAPMGQSRTTQQEISSGVPLADAYADHFGVTPEEAQRIISSTPDIMTRLPPQDRQAIDAIMGTGEVVLPPSEVQRRSPAGGMYRADQFAEDFLSRAGAGVNAGARPDLSPQRNTVRELALNPEKERKELAKIKDPEERALAAARMATEKMGLESGVRISDEQAAQMGYTGENPGLQAQLDRQRLTAVLAGQVPDIETAQQMEFGPDAANPQIKEFYKNQQTAEPAGAQAPTGIPAPTGPMRFTDEQARQTGVSFSPEQLRTNLEEIRKGNQVANASETISAGLQSEDDRTKRESQNALSKLASAVAAPFRGFWHVVSGGLGRDADERQQEKMVAQEQVHREARENLNSALFNEGFRRSLQTHPVFATTLAQSFEKDISWEQLGLSRQEMANMSAAEKAKTAAAIMKSRMEYAMHQNEQYAETMKTAASVMGPEMKAMAGVDNPDERDKIFSAAMQNPAFKSAYNSFVEATANATGMSKAAAEVAGKDPGFMGMSWGPFGTGTTEFVPYVQVSGNPGVAPAQAGEAMSAGEEELYRALMDGQ